MVTVTMVVVVEEEDVVVVVAMPALDERDYSLAFYSERLPNWTTTSCSTWLRNRRSATLSRPAPPRA
jgi:hypothetical protein